MHADEQNQWSHLEIQLHMTLPKHTKKKKKKGGGQMSDTAATMHSEYLSPAIEFLLIYICTADSKLRVAHFMSLPLP